jgi:hypothetical protein
MSFRLEEKIIFNDSDLVSFRHFLRNKKVKKLYPQRLILSIYFENKLFQSYEDSEEGILPRKKIRIRSYPNDNTQTFTLEIKTSSIEGRYKISNNISVFQKNHYLKFGTLNDLYGMVMPVVTVSYIREYYKLENFRITVDTNITYKNYLTNNLITEKMNVVELKASFLQDPDRLLKLIPYSRSRFSKYSNAVLNLGVSS